MLILWIVILLLAVPALTWLAVIVHKSKPTQETPATEIPADCCGAHAVCERDSLLTKTNNIIYFDDEELDVLANRDAETYTEGELKQLEEVFYTLREQDVAGWLRSLQLRNIVLPDYLRDEALLIVSERRSSK